MHTATMESDCVHADKKLTAFLELEAAVRSWVNLSCQANEIFSKLAVKRI